MPPVGVTSYAHAPLLQTPPAASLQSPLVVQVLVGKRTNSSPPWKAHLPGFDTVAWKTSVSHGVTWFPWAGVTPSARKMFSPTVTPVWHPAGSWCAQAAPPAATTAASVARSDPVREHATIDLTTLIFIIRDLPSSKPST